MAGVACGESWAKATDYVCSRLALQVALDIHVTRPSGMALPLGCSPIVLYQTRAPSAITAMASICVASPQLRCRHYRHNCNATAGAGGERGRESGGHSGGQSGWRKRAQPTHQRAASKCSSWCAPLLYEWCRVVCCMLCYVRPPPRLMPLYVVVRWLVLRVASVGQRRPAQRVNAPRCMLPSTYT